MPHPIRRHIYTQLKLLSNSDIRTETGGRIPTVAKLETPNFRLDDESFRPVGGGIETPRPNSLHHISCASNF